MSDRHEGRQPGPRFQPVAADGVTGPVVHDPGKPALYIIGDSHVSFFAQKTEMIPAFPALVKSLYPDVWVCRLGAALAGTMHRQDTTEKGRIKAFDALEQIPTGSQVFLVLGEIDCRMHIPKRAGFDPERIAETVLDTTANYFAFVTEFHARAAGRDIRVGLMSPPPTYDIPSSGISGRVAKVMSNGRSTRAKQIFSRVARNLFHKKSAMRAALMVSYSYSGSTGLRNTAVRAMRDEYRGFCEANGLMFVDLFSPFGSPSGDSDRRWFWDDIHLHGDSVFQLLPQFAGHHIGNFSTGKSMMTPASRT